MDQGEYKRVYLFQERPGDGGPRGVFTYSLPRFGSTMGEVESIPAAALVSRPSQYGKNIHLDNQVGPAMIHPAQLATKGPAWSELFDGGVKQAPIVGVTLQILEQVMYLSINLSLSYIYIYIERERERDLLTSTSLINVKTNIKDYLKKSAKFF